MSIQSISAPGDQALFISVKPGNKLKFDFDIAAVAFDRQNDNLIISFEDGGHVELGGFFLANDTGGSLPVLQLQDGEEVESASFFPVVNASLDLSVGVGPDSLQQEQGSGLSDFTADAGDLIDGVGRLDALKTALGKFGTTSSEGPTPQSGLRALADGSETGPGTGGGGPGTGPGTGGGEEPGAQAGHDLRAVLYMHAALDTGATGGRAVSTGVFFQASGGDRFQLLPEDIASFNGVAAQSGAHYAVKTSLPEGWDASWVDFSFDSATGRIVISLTPEGFLELQRLHADGGDNLLDYFRVTVTDTVSGESFAYTTQVVATTSPEFNSYEQDAKDAASDMGPDLNLGGEYHGSEGEGLGTSDAKFTIVGSAGTDEIIFNERFANGSELWASAQSEGKLTGAEDKNYIFLRQGMEANGAGVVNTIDSSGGDIELSSFSDSGLYYEAITALDGGRNIINGENLIVREESGFSRTIHATGQDSENVITLSGDLFINGTVMAGNGYIFAQDGGTNTITAEGKLIVNNGAALPTIQAYGGATDVKVQGIDIDNAFLMVVGGGGTASVTSCGDVNLNIVSSGCVAISALFSGSEANLTTTKGDVNFSCKDDDNLFGPSGLAAAYGGKTSVDAAGNFNFEGSTRQMVDGMFANLAGTNSLVAGGDVTFTLTRCGDSARAAIGMNAQGSGSSNTIQAAAGTVTFSLLFDDEQTRWGNDYGGIMVAKGGTNAITAEHVVLEHILPDSITGATVFGMKAQGGGNLVTATKSVDLSVTGIDANAMAAYAESSNVITAGESVRVSAEGKNEAWALYAYNGGSNVIRASEDSQGITVVIEAKGGKDQFAMFADDSSTNRIEGSEEGNDYISITGDIKHEGTGQNIIITHDGDNTIRLNGAVGEGSLTIVGGEGHDTLILHADSVEAFNEFYQEWLTSMPAGDIVAMSMDAIQISLGNLDGIDWNTPDTDNSLGWLQDLASDHGIQLEFNLGGAGDIKLGDLANVVGGVSFIDLTGGAEPDVLNIDDALNALGFSLDTLYIRGDSTDRIVMSDDWTKQEDSAGINNGVTYNAYCDGNGGTVYLQTELDVMIATGGI